MYENLSMLFNVFLGGRFFHRQNLTCSPLKPRDGKGSDHPESRGILSVCFVQQQGEQFPFPIEISSGGTSFGLVISNTYMCHSKRKI